MYKGVAATPRPAAPSTAGRSQPPLPPPSTKASCFAVERSLICQRRASVTSEGYDTADDEERWHAFFVAHVESGFDECQTPAPVTASTGRSAIWSDGDDTIENGVEENNLHWNLGFDTAE